MTMLAEGKYDARVLGGKVTLSSRNQTPQFEFELGVWDGQREVRKVSRLFLTDKAYDYTREKLERMGFNGNFDEPAFSDEVTGGYGLVVEVEYEEYEGKQQERVQIAGSGSGAPAGRDVTARLNSLWKQRHAAPPPRPGGRPAAPPAPRPPAAPPPPAAPATGPDPSTVTDRDTCWAYYLTTPDVKRNGPQVGPWQKAIAEVAAARGKAEAAFDGDDWREVAGKFIPF